MQWRACHNGADVG